MPRFQWAIIALWVSVAGGAWAVPPEPWCCIADVNGDGVVNAEDAVYCAPFFGTDNPECDLDGNGAVSVSDMTIIADCDGTVCTAWLPSLTPTGAGLAAGALAVAGVWAYRCRRHSG